MDEEDLQRLCDLCNLGRAFRSADYLWLDLVDASSHAESPSESRVALQKMTGADGSNLNFWTVSQSSFEPLPDGAYWIAPRVTAVIELKTIITDLHAKLAAAYQRGKEWADEALRILAAHLQERLRDAHSQIRNTKRLLRCEEALGVVILLESGRTVIPLTVYGGYLIQTINPLDCLDGVLYLSNDAEGAPRAPLYVMKNRDDPRSSFFHKQMDAVVRRIDTDTDGNVVSRVAGPDIVAEVVLDDAARLAFTKDWEEALRLGHRVTINFQERSRFPPSMGVQD